MTSNDRLSEEVARLYAELAAVTKERDEFRDCLATQCGKTLVADLALTAAQAENTRLRAALALSDQPCAYCSLPADEWAKCESGFPGCARGDDAMGCPELGARMELSAAHASAERMRVALTPSAETKAAYIGEFRFSEPYTDEDGDEQEMTITVPWTTIKDIMAAILARSALAEEARDGC